jgi:hypothetical protein
MYHVLYIRLVQSLPSHADRISPLNGANVSDHAHTQGDGRAALKHDVKVAATVVVVATVLLSFTALRDLARMCGFEHGLDWVWPICLDAVAYLGTRVWLAKGNAWRFARGLSISAVALSLIANGLVHGQKGVPPHWTIVVLVGAVPPLMLALVIHMLVADGSENTAAPATPVKPAPVKAPKKVAVKPEPEIIVPRQATADEPTGTTSLTEDMRKAGWAPGDYSSAKAAMRAYLEIVDGDTSGADLERVVGEHFTIAANSGAGRRVVREFKADMAAAASSREQE